MDWLDRLAWEAVWDWFEQCRSNYLGTMGLQKPWTIFWSYDNIKKYKKMKIKEYENRVVKITQI